MSVIPASARAIHRPSTSQNARRLVSHDLRAALADILDGLRIIDPSGLSQGDKLQFGRVRHASESLARLLDTALDPSHAAMGAPEPVQAALRDTQITEIDFHRFLHDIETRWRGRAESADLEFHVKLSAQVPPKIRTDLTSLERILSNVLGNALKFTGNGQVTLSVDVFETEELRISVTDTGAGFSDAALERIFALAPPVGTSSTDGSGLGLHIARTLADALGGQLQITNLAGGGACVCFRLPLENRAIDAAVTAKTDLPDLTGNRILLADDNDTNQLVAQGLLQKLGAEVVVANDGAEALDLVDQQCFDLALVDIEMPRVNGLEFLAALRARPGADRSLPVLALTAYVLADDRERIYAAGADGIISKPIMDIAAFGVSIRSVLRSVQTTRPIFDRARLTQLLDMVGDANAPEVARRLVWDLETSESGLRNAVEAADMTAVQKHSHVLSSLAATLGAENLRDGTIALEDAARTGDQGAVLLYWRKNAPTVAELRRAIEMETREPRRVPA